MVVVSQVSVPVSVAEQAWKKLGWQTGTTLESWKSQPHTCCCVSFLQPFPLALVFLPTTSSGGAGVINPDREQVSSDRWTQGRAGVPLGNSITMMAANKIDLFTESGTSFIDDTSSPTTKRGPEATVCTYELTVACARRAVPSRHLATRCRVVPRPWFRRLTNVVERCPALH